MFYALAIVCDDFFVPSLEKICEVRGGIFQCASERPEVGTLPWHVLASSPRSRGIINVSTRMAERGQY